MELTPSFHPLLDTPIAELDVSTEFRLRAKLLGFRTIREITVCNKGALHGHRDFRYGWYKELLDVLAREDLVHLMN